MKDEHKEQLWREFWEGLQRQGWRSGSLARRLGVGPDVVKHWLDVDNCPSVSHISQLLTTPDLLSEADKLKLAKLSLLSLGFSQSSFPLLADASHSLAIAPLAERTHLLALCPFPGRSRVYFSELLTGLSDRATKEGFVVHVQPIPNTRYKRPLREYYPHLDELRGVVAFTCHVEESTWLQECREAGLPIVLVHDNMKRNQVRAKGGYVALVWESMTGLEKAVDHLTSPASYHCKQVRVIMAKPQLHFQRRRKLDTIIKVAEKNGVQIDVNEHLYTVDHYSFADGRRVCEEDLAKDPDAEAIICLQDDLAHAVADYARIHHRQLRITGYDNSPVASEFNLSSVDQYLQQTGEDAFNQLQNLINGHFTELPIPHEIHTEFRPRVSSDWKS